jgi:hypothetical protein
MNLNSFENTGLAEHDVTTSIQRFLGRRGCAIGMIRYMSRWRISRVPLSASWSDVMTQRKETRSRPDGNTERLSIFEVLGKARPCLIISKSRSGYYLVWNLTSNRPCAPLRTLRRYDGKPTPSFLRDHKRYPNETRWTHEKLAGELVGEISHHELND